MPRRQEYLHAATAILATFCVAFTVAAQTPAVSRAPADDGPWTICWFAADVTIPLGHRCMGVLPVKAREIVDTLEARGFVLCGPGAPIVVVGVDWCEIRNDAYDRWRDALAAAAGTTRERVLAACLHQHDAPVVDLAAAKILDAVGLQGELCNVTFHEEALGRVCEALRRSLSAPRRVTHVGCGAGQVERIASNRRVVLPDGRVSFGRGSSSGSQAWMRDAPEGLIDPWLRTVSFWDGDVPLVALSTYATHPMSFYGRGGVSADFVGIARRQQQESHPGVFQVYLSGCSGDVTAGKFNDGSSENRPALADRLRRAMEHAWKTTRRRPIDRIELRVAKLRLDFHDGREFTATALDRVVHDASADVRERILAAMGLASRQRIASHRDIDLACLDLGAAELVLFPGESFVGYQLMAQQLRPDIAVVAVGYGECWPGYIPTRQAFAEGFDEGWRWVGRGADSRIRDSLWRVLSSQGGENLRDGQEISRDVFVASAEHPRISEGSVLPRADGSLLYAATEFTGDGSDFAAARLVACVSQDGGGTWSPPYVLQENVGARNVMSASLLRFHAAERSGVGLFYLVKNDLDDLDIFLRVSGDDGMTFGPPEKVTDGPGYHVMNNDRVIQMTTGRILCPVAWTRDVRHENHFVSFCYLTDDGGRTWRRGRGEVDLPKRGAMEPEVLELRDSRLLMTLRTQLGEIHTSYSGDGGESWSPPAPWGVASPESPSTLRRIPATGDLLLVWNPRVSEGADHGGRRSPLAAAISSDEGRTWTSPRILEADPVRAHAYAYTSVTFQDDRVLLTYYVEEERTGRIGSRFRSLPLAWFYTDERKRGESPAGR